MTDKKDLQQPATKGDLEELRNEVKDIDKRLSGQIKDVKETLSSQTDTLSTQIDGLAKLIKDQTEEFQIHKLTHQRQNDKLDDHEKRINQLENATP